MLHFDGEEILKQTYKTHQHKNTIEQRKRELIISEDEIEKLDFKKLTKLIDSIGSINSDTMLYINTVNYIEGLIKHKQIEAQQYKRKELNRISKEYFRNDYERRFRVPVETMFSAIVGDENISSELVRHNKEHRVRF